jgi:hypothetical protein
MLTQCLATLLAGEKIDREKLQYEDSLSKDNVLKH